ncbi:MAG TPA: beta-glucosidase BglX [Flavisolibacter sp.]|nr:beta-glucosidase BglX [Flavisolibacter sp.]
MIRKIFIGVVIFVSFQAAAQQSNNAKMNLFISNLMKRMTLEEKIGQLNLLTPGGGILTGAVVSQDVESKIKAGNVGGLFGVIGVDKIRQAQELAVNGSRLKIPLLFGSDVIHGYKTTFPIPLGLSSSWDISMIERSARVAGTEATADGLNWVFSPMVDIARDPRWGRVAEGAGEDPYLGSQVAKAMVRGYQGQNLAADNTLMACVKHFALYGAAEGGRDYNTVDMSRLKMYEYYLPPYKAAVDAGVGSVMTSFNEIDGIPATGNKWLLTDLLRTQWGFKGFVVTDYTSINEMIDHGSGDLQTVSAMSLRAGTDMDMVGEGFLTTLKKSLKEGKVTQKQIDDACRRVLEAKYKLGLFDDPYRYTNATRAAREVLSPDKRVAAREFAVRSAVLLKNEKNTLPLKKTGTVALIGPLANNKNNMLGTWAVSGDITLSVPVLEGVQNAAGRSLTVLYSKGANISDDTTFAKKVNVFGTRIDIDSLPPDQLLNNALETAARADVVVAVVGEASEMSGESANRSDINLPESQKRLLEALAKTGKPLVVVLMSGRPLTIERENQIATSILQVWHPGHEAGNAVADLLFGAYNPSGKLTMTFPRNVGQVPIYYNHKRTGRPQAGDEFQKFRSNYLDVPNSPLFPFGYGLSYTTFSYSDIQLSSNTMNRTGAGIKATVTVTNTGAYNGDEVVQLYIHDPVASVTQPVKKLKGFQKVFLRQGESKQVTFNIGLEELKFFNSDLKWVAEPGEFKVFIGTSSSDVKEASFTLK